MRRLLVEGNTTTQKDQRRGRRFPHFVQITLRPRKDGRAQQGGQSVDFSLAGMKIRVEGERLPGRVFRVFMPNSDPPQVCGVGEVRWERRMPHACEFGLAFRTTTTDYRDLIRALRQAVRERSQQKGVPRTTAPRPKTDDSEDEEP